MFTPDSRGRLQLCVLLVIGLTAIPAWSAAATRTWSGGGGNALWSNPANWAENVAPVDGDSLVFPDTAGPTTLTNDLTNLLVHSILVASARTFTGNGIRLEAGITMAVAGALVSTFDLPIELTGHVTLAGATTGTLKFDGVISGSGGVDLSGGVAFTRANTYTGGTTLVSSIVTPPTGRFTLDAHEAIPGAPVLNLASQAALVIDQHRQTTAGLTSIPANASENEASTVTLTSGPGIGQQATVILSGSNTYSFKGVFAGSGLIRHTGTGHQTFLGDSTGLTGSATIEHGTLEVGHTLPIPISIAEDGHLVLNGGTTGSVTVTGGGVTLSATSTSSQTPGLAFTGGTFTAQAAIGPVLGHVAVNGPVSLGNATLTLDIPVNFGATVGNDLVLVDKTSAGAVSGTFAGLPEGATVSSNGYVFQLTYTGGDGNDIVLRLQKLSREYLLSEGATSDFFKTDILIANPNSTAVPTKVEFFPTGAAPVTLDITMDAMSRKTIRVNDVAGLSGAEFSTQVTSLNAMPLIVERTMSWDASGYGAHSEHAAEALSTTWYFAEGSQGFFKTFLLLANPQDTANTATVQYLRTDEPMVERTYELNPRSRRTVDIGADSALVNRSFGMVVTFTQPGMAERSMYFGDTPFLSGGHESAGVTAISPTWFLPEGATGPFFETFILLANPGTSPVNATLTFLPAGGQPVSVTVPVAAKARQTINIEQQDASLINAAVATQVTATGPIIAERAQYWPDPYTTWYETHNSFGVTELATRWGLAEGRVGMNRAYQTYILLANPNDNPAHVTITFLRDGKAAVTKAFDVDPKTRFNVTVGPGSPVPELVDETFGAVLESNQPIAVERAMYNDANGLTWAAGTSATAVKLP
jgi:hypothetical protein